MAKYSNIHCNNCARKLTEKEASVYDLIWKHSGDMYCNKCRSCLDDCRKKPCKLKQKEANKIVSRIVGGYQREYYRIEIIGNNLMRLQNTGVTNGVAIWQPKTYVNMRESYWSINEYRGEYLLAWSNLKDVRPTHLYSESAMSFVDFKNGKAYSKTSGQLLWSDDEGIYAPYFKEQ